MTDLLDLATLRESVSGAWGTGHRARAARWLNAIALRDAPSPDEQAMVDAIRAGHEDHSPDANNEFRRALRGRLHAEDPLVQQRALAMIAKVKRPELTATDVAMGETLIERIWEPPSAQ